MLCKPLPIQDNQLVGYLVPVPVPLRSLFRHIPAGQVKQFFQGGIVGIYAFCFRNLPVLAVPPFNEICRVHNAKDIIGAGNFIEIYVSTPLAECEKRDVKGLYKKAREGRIPNFTGISAPYEAPANPQITVDTSQMPLEEAVQYVVSEIEKYL